jgi:hypothetical protein
VNWSIFIYYSRLDNFFPFVVREEKLAQVLELSNEWMGSGAITQFSSACGRMCCYRGEKSAIDRKIKLIES